ncbi:MAG: 4Fe-4S binding protein [Anaerolineaceae bacterium]|nr:4Fe-4S binding protein [Anaerolineaceae bacterium]
MFCGFCVEACPTDAITHGHHHPPGHEYHGGHSYLKNHSSCL